MFEAPKVLEDLLRDISGTARRVNLTDFARASEGSEWSRRKQPSFKAAPARRRYRPEGRCDERGIRGTLNSNPAALLPFELRDCRNSGRSEEVGARDDLKSVAAADTG